MTFAQELRPLSLEEALRLARSTSEELRSARADVRRSGANVERTKSQRRPQLNGSASYQRTLASQFSGFGGGAQPEVPPDCQQPYVPDPTLPLEERVAILERRLVCPDTGGFGGIDFSQLGFGAPNTWSFGLNASWLFFTGGRVEAQVRAAEELREISDIGVAITDARTQLDVTAAYFDAQLASEFVEIAEASVAQAEETLRITSIRAREGAQPEFDVLQARVTRDNQRPALIRSRAMRDLAFDRLRALIDLPDQPLRLTTPVAPEPATDVPPAAERAPVQQAARRVEAAEEQLRAARALRRPSIAAQSQYGQVAYSDDFLPGGSDFRENWVVGASLQIPIYSGGRIRADIDSARADVEDAEAQLDRISELAHLDTLAAVTEVRTARAEYEATEGTVEQAARGLELAQLRYHEGISIALEVQNARLLLEQARVNRAQAARDLRVAQTRLELLPFLPLGAAAPSQQRQPAASAAPQQSSSGAQQLMPSSPIPGAGGPQ